MRKCAGELFGWRTLTAEVSRTVSATSRDTQTKAVAPVLAHRRPVVLMAVLLALPVLLPHGGAWSASPRKGGCVPAVLPRLSFRTLPRALPQVPAPFSDFRVDLGTSDCLHLLTQPVQVHGCSRTGCGAWADARGQGWEIAFVAHVAPEVLPRTL